ncbi:MAG TPA: hypothetical protein PLY70_03960 [Saprospiraceae bacterium]|nr:hypothetical protein [Saprospiraceae bacterium]HPN67982.1 hypothetical protein [Saprospiraceae bacterium]
MKDITVKLSNEPGMLALFGKTLGSHKISLEGGGIFDNGVYCIGHFLVKEAEQARDVLAQVGIEVTKISDVLIQRLRQDVPGQLGLFCQKMADAGVNILVQYSDHDHQLILVVDDFDKGMLVSKQWMKDNFGE